MLRASTIGLQTIGFIYSFADRWLVGGIDTCAPFAEAAAIADMDTEFAKQTIRPRLQAKAVEILRASPDGVRFSELSRTLQEAFPSINVKTINNSILTLLSRRPVRVYKPYQGMYRLIEYRRSSDVALEAPRRSASHRRTREEQFYPLFASWLRDEMEEVTHAIALGGNAFRDRWGTPDVIGKAESRPSDVIKRPTSIVAAEIKIGVTGLVAGFGQACAYRLFSHKSYLVIPMQIAAEELSRLSSLCQMFGLGLVLFNPQSTAAPDFKLLVRPIKHEPDLYYTNKYIKRVERQLF